MITYFHDKTGRVRMIDYGVVELTEQEKNDPLKIQLEEEYQVPEQKGKVTVLYVEDGQLKHRYDRYENIEVKEDEKLKKLEEKTAKNEKEVTKLESKVKSVQLAVAEWYATEDTTAAVGDSGETI